MNKAAVIGHPISHSLSPKLHGFLLEKYGIEGSYEALDVAPRNLEDFLLNNEFTGFNVTIPHKERVFDIFAANNWQISPQARAVKAINTVYREDGGFVGDNSDIFGFAMNLEFFTGADFMAKKGKKAVVLGAGGAAGAVVFALLNANFERVAVINRTLSKAEALARDYDNVAVGGFADLNDADLLVNTTSLGMVGQAGLDLDISALPRDAAVCDIVYKPLMTDLLKKAQDRGNLAVTGIGMLIFQAFAGFERWFGVRPKLTKEEFVELSEMLICP